MMGIKKPEDSTSRNAKESNQQAQSASIESESGPSSKIELPEDNQELVDQLKRKLSEYRQRRFEIKGMGHAGGFAPAENKYKIAILEELLYHGSFDINNLPPSIRQMDVGVVNPRERSGPGVIQAEPLESAFGIIEDYVRTGGKNLSGGTGLKK